MSRYLLWAVVFCLTTFQTASAQSVTSGDINRDGVVDRDDLDLVSEALNQPVGLGDPRDLDNDQRITVLDLRKLVLQCSNPLCASDPRKLGPFPTSMTVIDEGCNFDLDLELPVSWIDPPFSFTTPIQVSFGDDDLFPFDTRCPDKSKGDVDMKARVHFPGSGKVVAPGGPFPLVLILHGQQLPDTPGFEGYDYLGELLASRGFIVASIDGRSLLDATIKSRGEHIREHLRRFVARNALGSGSFLERQIDLSKVTLVGHSRGGEAVVAAWEWQRVKPNSGYRVAAIVAIAPVQFFGNPGRPEEPNFTSHLRDVHYQIIQGSHDCDVADFQGYRQYDRAADIRAVGETLKSMVFVKDANHNFFNVVWESEFGDECQDNGIVLDGNVARDIATVYIHAFLQTVIKGRVDFRLYLTGDIPNPVVELGKTTVAIDFQAPGSGFVPLDHFEELPGTPHDKTRNSRGGLVVAEHMTYEEQRFASLDPSSPALRFGYGGETFAAYFRWEDPSARFVSLFTADPRPLGLTHLSFRVGQIPQSISPNPQGQNQDFTVTVATSAGVRSVRVSDFAPIHAPFPIPTPKPRLGKTVMSVVRIPLRAFNNPLSTILGVEFRFDQIGGGEIMVDDIRLTK